MLRRLQGAPTPCPPGNLASSAVGLCWLPCWMGPARTSISAHCWRLVPPLALPAPLPLLEEEGVHFWPGNFAHQAEAVRPSVWALACRGLGEGGLQGQLWATCEQPPSTKGGGEDHLRGLLGGLNKMYVNFYVIYYIC